MPARPAAAVAAVAVVLSAAACRDGVAAKQAAAPATRAPRELATPALPGSLAPSLFAAADGRLLLSWLEPRAGGAHALRLATRSAGGAWSDPLEVAEGVGWFVNWADFPHAAALADGTLVAHWLEKRGGGTTYEYDVRLTRSRDSGRSWEPAFSPYRDETPGEHGFVALAPTAAARVGILFLDGRETKRADGAMTLRFATLGSEGAPEPDALVDPRVCDCCQTALARTSRGLVAAYRDRSASEVRDVAVARLENGRWSEPVFPGAEGWQIHACPVNGPALAAEGDRVALAWFTMAGETPRVKVAFSEDGGASWGAPQAVDDGRPIGRVGIALAGGRDGGAVVSWLEQADSGASLRLRRVHGSRPGAASTAVAATSAARSSGVPQLAAAGAELVVAWRDTSEPARIRTALVEVP
jgi:hypothetical protein